MKQALTGFIVNKQGIDGTTVHLEVNVVISQNEERHARNAGKSRIMDVVMLFSNSTLNFILI